jgi:hypothetical protein
LKRFRTKVQKFNESARKCVSLLLPFTPCLVSIRPVATCRQGGHYPPMYRKVAPESAASSFAYGTLYLSSFKRLLKDLDPCYSQRRYYHEPIQNLLSSPVRDIIHILFQNSQTPSKLSVCAIQINALLPSLFFKSDVRRMKSLAPSSSSWKLSVLVTLTPFPNGASGYQAKWMEWKQSPPRNAHFVPPAFVLTRAIPARLPTQWPGASTRKNDPSPKKSYACLNGPSG